MVGTVKRILIMIEQDKQLLLKDLSARLPYNPYIFIKEDNVKTLLTSIEVDKDEIVKIWYNGIPYSIEDIKPYLRPMSSMTEEEKKEVRKLSVCDDGAFHNDIYDVGISMEEAFNAISWFLERHFDINYLIQKGLALEAPEGMYNV